MIETLNDATNPIDLDINIDLNNLTNYDEESIPALAAELGVNRDRHEVEVIYYVTKTYAIDSSSDKDTLLPEIRNIVFNEDLNNPGDSSNGERFDYIDIGEVYLDGERITGKI